MSQFEYRNGELYVESLKVADLVEKHGTPLWIYSQSKLLQEFNAIKTAFASADPVICYSVKANSNLTLLKILNEAGSSFDVVSGGELFRVKEAGADTTRVVFAGVGKTDAEIAQGLENNILMYNVESEAELDAISRIAAKFGRVAPVALRLNPDIDGKTHAKTTTGKRGNKFGMDIEKHNELAAKVLKDPYLELRGIHLHIGSPINTVEPYQESARKAYEVVTDLRKQGHETNWINLGGGFGLNYRGNEAATASQYAEAILPWIEKAECRLALEPGRTVCGNAGILVSRVIYTKREGGKLFVIQDAAMNDLVRPAMYDSFHAIWPVQPSVEKPVDFEAEIPGCEVTDIVGPICESGDYLAKGRYFPPVSTGDLICTFSSGAYGTVMSSNYNSRPRAAEILVNGAESKVIRRRETYEDLIAAER